MLKSIMQKEFIMGVVFGIITHMIMMYNIPHSNYRIIKDTIDKCELTLPRDMHCVITAIPVAKETK
jgi:hypothetical protein